MVFIKERKISISVCIAVVVVSILLFIGVLSLQKALFSTQGNILNGSWTSSMDKAFDENLKHYVLSLSFWNKLNHVLFKEGKEGVLIGEDGWLFTTEEFDHPKGFEQNVQNNLNYILNVQKNLSEIGVELIVMPIPSKARVLEDKLGRYSFPEYRRGVYEEFFSFLEKNKINSFNLLNKASEQKDFFLKSDTHWSLDGAESASKAVVEVVPRNILEAHKQQYVLLRGDHKSIEGDLTRYTVKQEEVIGTIELSGGVSDDLFSDSYIPVTLVGTSYSANKNWGFESLLKYYLQADVLNMADEGVGPFEVMESYLNSDELKNMKPKVVVWEIPERYLPIKFKKKTK